MKSTSENGKWKQLVALIKETQPPNFLFGISLFLSLCPLPRFCKAEINPSRSEYEHEMSFDKVYSLFFLRKLTDTRFF